MKETIQDVVRLSQREYERLESSLGISMSPTTTPEQVAYMLGQQSVLLILRKGFTIGTRTESPPPGGN